MKIKYGIFFALISFFLHAQIISGKIQSKIDKEPIPFARVGILDENFGVISNENGEFSIDLTGVDQNKKLVVQVGGYENFSIEVQKY